MAEGAGDDRDDSRADDDSAGPAARFRDTALASGLVDRETLASAEEAVAATLGDGVSPERFDQAVADVLVERGVLTRFQATKILAGHRKLTLGQYRILDLLGQGGMGQVFKAEHAMMGREVAVKVLPRAKSTPDTEAAFRREIRMLGRLDHPNLVRALDAGHDGKVYYLVTELVEGVDLRKQVLRYGTLDEVAAASVICQVARGLAYAHAQGLVHRDVKPGNILVTPAGIAKLLDVGLAGSVLESESTRLGRVVGTMDYMAPEQIRAPDGVGPAADVYGLGCTLYFVLAGQVPFPGGTRQDKARRQLHEAPAPIRQFAPGVSEAFCRVVDSMMEKDPVLRIGTPEAVIEWLRPWTPEVPVPMGRRARKRGGRGDGDASPGEPNVSASGSSGYASGIQAPAGRSSRRSGSGAESLYASSGDGGPSSWEWPSLPSGGDLRSSPARPAFRRLLSGPLSAAVPVAFALSVAVGLAAAMVVVMLRLAIPALAGLLPTVGGPLVIGILAFVASFLAFLTVGTAGKS